MSHEENQARFSLPAAADLSAKQYYAVIVDSSGNAAVAGAGERACGVLQNAPAAAGRAAAIAYGGVTKVVCGGAVTIGNPVAVDSAGKIVAETTGDAWTVGIALETGTSGKIISMLLQPSGLMV